MVCLGLEPGAAGWWGQMNPLGYGGIYCLTPTIFNSDESLMQVYFVSWHTPGSYVTKLKITVANNMKRALPLINRTE